MPGDPTTPLAYKEFTKDVVEQAKAAERSVIFRDLLQPADRADLDRDRIELSTFRFSGWRTTRTCL